MNVSGQSLPPYQEQPLPSQQHKQPPKIPWYIVGLLVLSLLFLIVFGAQITYRAVTTALKNKNVQLITPKQYICDKASASYLPEIPLVIIKTVQTTIDIKSIIDNGITTATSSTKTITSDNSIATKEELQKFKEWAQAHNITLIGITKDYQALKENKLDLKKDTVDIENITFVMNAYKGLQQLPESVLEIMNGRAIYLSTAEDNNYAVYVHEGSETLGGVFLVEPVSDKAAIHEVGHLIGTIGIENRHKEALNARYARLVDQYHRLFAITGLHNLPCGYVSVYSTKNKAENFAEHFAFYVVRGKEFKERTKSDEFLREKYDFLKENIFNGVEY